MKSAVRAGLVVVVIGVVSLSGVLAQQPASAARLFQEGLLIEQAGGKLADAIFRYERVIAEFPKDRDVIPKALYQLGMAYQKQQNPRAVLMFSRLASEFPTVQPLATDARARLAVLQSELSPFKARSLDALEALEVYPSPDGRYVAFEKKAKTDSTFPGGMPEYMAMVLGPKQLMLYDYATGREQPLVKDVALFSSVRWSPDSQMVAFMAVEPPKSFADYMAPNWLGSSRVQVVTVATSRVRTLPVPNAKDLSWSPDGKHVATRESAAQARLGDVKLTTVSTNQMRSLGQTDGPAEFAWSPDSTRLAFHATDRATKVDDVRIVTVATAQTRALSVPPATEGTRSQLGGRFSTKWTARNELVYRIEKPKIGGDIYFVPVDGGPPRLVCEARQVSGGPGCGDITTDGTRILRFDQATKRMLWLDVPTGVSRPVTMSSGEENAANAVSPDLKLVSFAANRDGRWGLYVAPLDRGVVQNPVRIAMLDSRPSQFQGKGWGTNGRLVLRLGFDRSDLYRLDTDRQTGRTKGSLERLTQDSIENSSPAMSADGSRVAYRYRHGSRQGLAVMDAASGANERPVADQPFSPSTLNPSSKLDWLSGDEVVYLETAPKDGQPSGLFAVNTKTGSTRAVPHGRLPGTYWAYVPARNELLYIDAKGRPVEPLPLKARSLLDGTERLVTENVLSFAVSRDGRSLAYVTVPTAALEALEKTANPPNDPKALGVLLDSKLPVEFHVSALDGANDRIVARANVSFMSFVAVSSPPLSFSPDGRFLLYRSADESSPLQVVATSGGSPWPLLDKTALPGVTWTDAHWGSDGSILLTGSSNRAEVRAWDGLSYAAVVKLLGASRRP